MAKGGGRHLFRMCLCMAWAIPWSLLGALLFITIIGIPAALICFSFAGMPAVKETRRRLAELQGQKQQMYQDQIRLYMQPQVQPTQQQVQQPLPYQGQRWD